MPFSIHEHLRQARNRHNDPLFPVYGNVKKYERMPKLLLDEPVEPNVSLTTALKNRRSFGVEAALALRNLNKTDISNLFGLSLRAAPNGKRSYPSGGARYPIETYLIGNVDEGARVYHYDPLEHALDDLWEFPERYGISNIVPKSEVSAPACLIFTALWERNNITYGDFGYYMGMLEMGHAAQNILLVAAALNIAAHVIGGFDDALLRELLDLDEQLEQSVYVLLIGKKKL